MVIFKLNILSVSRNATLLFAFVVICFGFVECARGKEVDSKKD